MGEPIEDASYCEGLLRRFDRDRWLASLFLPQELRSAVRALYALDVELKRVRDVVSDPLPGEVRLQWWRDLVQGEARGGAAGNPVAAEVERAMARHNLPRAAFGRLVDARTQDLYDDPPQTMTDLEGYLGDTSSALLRLSALVLAGGHDPGSPDAAGHGGVAEGLVGILGSLAAERQLGRLFLPAETLERHGVDRNVLLTGQAPRGTYGILAELGEAARRHLARAEAEISTLPPMVKPAFLSLSLTGPRLRRIEGVGTGILRQPADLPQWRRQWKIWRAARLI